jgi:IS5 family transposase
MRDIFDPLFDLQDAHLKKLGNPFEELQHLINWEIFRPELDKLYKKERKSNAGAKPKDVVMMFKGLVVQNLYGLSDDQLEYQLEDRRSFQRFLGLNKHERSPDAKTFWVFREKLTQLNLIESLFKTFFQQLNQAGYIARKGQIIDASFVPVPRQHNKRSENLAIKEGNPPEDWSDNKRRQKDTDARWTKNNNKSTFGFKNHVQIDNQHKLIRDYAVTDASVHDSNVFEELLDKSNTSKDVWADSTYGCDQ